MGLMDDEEADEDADEEDGNLFAMFCNDVKSLSSKFFVFCDFFST